MAYTKVTPELEKKVIKQYLKSDEAHKNCKLLEISTRTYYLVLKKNKVFKENNPLDMVGKKFNRVKVLKFLPKQTKIKRMRMYRCLCDCGKNFNTRGLPLIYGTTKSCGCWFKEFAGQHTVTHGLTRVGHVSPIATMFINAKRRAKVKGIPFTITISDIILPKYCPVFPWIKIKRGLTGPIHTSPSLDRVIPELGYIPGNVFVISHKANTIKSFGTLKEHLAIAEYIKKNSKNNVPS
jgi:hypothetical protein